MAGVFGKSIAKASAIQANLKSANADVVAQFLDTSKIRCGPQTRKSGNPGLTQESIKELSDNIVANRQATPIIVRPDPEKVAEYLVVAGERRYLACKLAGIPVLGFVWEMNDEQHRNLQIAENLQREDLTAREIGEELQVDYEELGTYEKVAARWGKSLNWVHERVKFLKAVTSEGAAQQAVEAGLTADVSTVNDIARLDKADPEAARALVESAATEPGMNLRRAAREALKETKTANVPQNAPDAPSDKPTPTPSQQPSSAPAHSAPLSAVSRSEAADDGGTAHVGDTHGDGDVPPLLESPVAEPPAAKTFPRLMNLTQFAAACKDTGGGLVRFEREEWIAGCNAGELEDCFDNLETLLGRLALSGVPRIQVEFGGLAQ